MRGCVDGTDDDDMVRKCAKNRGLKWGRGGGRRGGKRSGSDSDGTKIVPERRHFIDFYANGRVRGAAVTFRRHVCRACRCFVAPCAMNGKIDFTLPSHITYIVPGEELDHVLHDPILFASDVRCTCR